VLPDRQAPAAVELPQCQLHVEERQSAEQQHYAVRDQKGSCNINEIDPIIRVFSLFSLWYLYPIYNSDYVPLADWVISK
jgi:hypothetical protein